MVTTPTRTLIDLGAVVKPLVVEAALYDVLRRRMTTMPRLKWGLHVSGGRGRRGCAVLRGLINEISTLNAPPQSILHAEVIRLLRRSGLPPPVVEHEIRSDGRFVARVDLAYPHAGVVIECDGFDFHSDRNAWEDDRRRLSRLAACGLRVVHVSARQMKEQAKAVIVNVRNALQAATREAMDGRSSQNAVVGSLSSNVQEFDVSAQRT